MTRSRERIAVVDAQGSDVYVTRVDRRARFVHEAEAALEGMLAESHPLAVHAFVSRRQYRNMPDTKSGSGVIWRLV